MYFYSTDKLTFWCSSIVFSKSETWQNSHMCQLVGSVPIKDISILKSLFLNLAWS